MASLHFQYSKNGMERRKIVLLKQFKKKINKSHTLLTIQMIKDENEMAIGLIGYRNRPILYMFGADQLGDRKQPIA